MREHLKRLAFLCCIGILAVGLKAQSPQLTAAQMAEYNAYMLRAQKMQDKQRAFEVSMQRKVEALQQERKDFEANNHSEVDYLNGWGNRIQQMMTAATPKPPAPTPSPAAKPEEKK